MVKRFRITGILYRKANHPIHSLKAHNSVEDEFSYMEEETYIEPQDSTQIETSSPAVLKEFFSKSKREIPNSDKLVILQPLAEGGHGLV